MFSIGAAITFPSLYVNPRAVAAAWLDRVPDATAHEVQTAAHALYGDSPLAAECVESWRVARFERETGHPF